MSEHLSAVSGFFSWDVDQMILPDLHRLRNGIRPDSCGLAGCTVPTAMFAFAVIDLIGYLIRPDPEAKRDETLKNITFALSGQAGLFPAGYEKRSKALVLLFRHGMMHQVFPKAAGLAKLPCGEARPVVFFSEGGTPNLNVDRLVDDLLAALSTLKDRVFSPASAPLATRMEDRIRILNTADQCQLQKLRQAGHV